MSVPEATERRYNPELGRARGDKDVNSNPKTRAGRQALNGAQQVVLLHDYRLGVSDRLTLLYLPNDGRLADRTGSGLSTRVSDY